MFDSIVQTVRRSKHSGRRAFQGKRHVAGRTALAGRTVQFEALESRIALTLLGVVPQSPIIGYDSNGKISYVASSDAFTLTATPLSIDTAPPNSLFSSGSIAIHIQVDSSGNLAGPALSNNFVLTGSVDTNGDFVDDFSGTLLTGKILAFGWQDSGGTTDQYDFRFAITGGALAGLYSGKDLAVVTTSENSTFTGDFNTDFGGNAKGSLGGTPPGPCTGSICGMKFQDCNGNGIKNYGEPGLAGWTIELDKDADGTVDATTQTLSDGSYRFTGLTPGLYRVREVGKSGWIQTTVNPSDITIQTGTRSVGNNFGNFKLVCITGKKFLDVTGNGITCDDKGLGGVTINLYQGTSTNGTLFSSTTTAADGDYHFSNLAPGTYFVQENVPTGWIQTAGKAGYVVTVGPGGIGSGGTASCKYFADYNPLCGLTCKIDSWACKNGQDLIKCFGKTSSGLTLANWLATSLPNLFGSGAGNYNPSSTVGTNLTNRSNAEVAAYFLALFNDNGPKTYAQLLATSLAVFTTTYSLNTGATSRYLASKLGFSLSAGGAGAAKYTVCQECWSAFGVTSSTDANKTILQLLKIANSATSSGILYGQSATLMTLTNSVFSALNCCGGIAVSV